MSAHEIRRPPETNWTNWHVACSCGALFRDGTKRSAVAAFLLHAARAKTP